MRIVALAAGVLFVVCGLLGQHHEATVVHVRDARTGALVHGEQVVGHHDQGVGSDIHAEDGPGDSDAAPCAIAAALHQPSASVEALLAPTAPSCEAVAARSIAVRAPPPRAAVYRLAPKTSPPAAS
jgi:hypothetical protein